MLNAIKNVVIIQGIKIQKMFAALILVGLASQVSLNLFESGFMVSAGVILFVIFLFNDEISPIPFGILSGMTVFVLRLLMYKILVGEIVADIVNSYIPEIISYVVYSIFFVLFLEKDAKENLGFIYVLFIICDFASNFIEIFIRYAILLELSYLDTIPTLLLVSFVRSSVVWIFLTGFNYYKMMLTKKEHEERYKKLLLLTSQLKAEVYWIEKNMENINKIAKQSHNLHENVANNINTHNWASLSLDIARNIDEIKKDNELVVRGIRDITENVLKDKGMSYKDITKILLESISKETQKNNKNIKFEFEIGKDFYTFKHYYVMSILRNLVVNSIDSIRKSQEDAKIRIIHQYNDESHIFTITDNGVGIDNEYLKQIFTPGFSTKVNYESGEINRGLGLSIVKCIVEEIFKGIIEIESNLGLGTTIKISIPKIYLEEKRIKEIV